MISNQYIHIAIFTGGFFPEPETTKNIWDTFSFPEYIIAADSGIDTLEHYTKLFPFFKPNMIVGDFDSISNNDILEKYSNIVKKFPTDKDYSDTELALQEAFEYAKKINKKPFVTLIGGDGGRIDHFIAIYDLFSEKKSPSLWLCKEQAIYLLNKNHEYTIRNISKKDNISISRLSSSRTKGKIISENLEWESNLFRKKGMPSLSNRIKENQKEIKLYIKQCNFILIAPLFAQVLDTSRKNINSSK